MILIVIHFGQAASTLPVRSAWHRLGAALIQWTQNNWRPKKQKGGRSLINGSHRLLLKPSLQT